MGRWALRSSVAIVFVFMLLPVFYVVLSSFSATATLAFPPRAFTLDWYKKIPPQFWESLRLSLYIAIPTAIISTILGTGIAIRIARWRGPGRAAFSAFCLSPLMVPPLVIGVALFQFGFLMWDWAGINPTGTAYAIIVGHIALALPFVVRAVLAGHAHFDASLEEAALNLGATPRQVFFKVTMPALMPGITSGTIFALLLSLDDVPVALLVGSGDEQTLPVKILTVLEYSYSPNIMAISAIMIYGSLLLMLLLDRLIGLERLFGFVRT